MKAPQYLLLVFVGLLACCWGLPTTHRWPSPRNLLPALATLLGVAMMLVGTLLTVLPHFFQE